MLDRFLIVPTLLPVVVPGEHRDPSSIFLGLRSCTSNPRPFLSGVVAMSRFFC